MTCKWVVFCLVLFGSFIDLKAASAKILKVLPHYIDAKGFHALSPSLYERDAYQALLRKEPKRRSGLRMDVNWRGRSKAPLLLKIELRGVKGNVLQTKMLEKSLEKQSFFSQWATVTFAGEEYLNFGELSAWRASIWEDGKELHEERSFLW